MVTKRNLQCYCIKCECLKTNLHLSCWTEHALMALLFFIKQHTWRLLQGFHDCHIEWAPRKTKGCVPLGRSGLGSGTNESTKRIYHFLWCIMTQEILDCWSWSRLFQWNTLFDLNLQPHTKLNVLISQGKFICWGMAWIGIRKEWSLTGEIEGWEKMVLFTVITKCLKYLIQTTNTI